MPITAICQNPVCQKPFTIRPSEIRRGIQRKFCSQQCRHPLDTEQKFWSNVQKTPECWLWQGSKDKRGYGRISLSHEIRSYLAHRYSYLLHYGDIKDNLNICHTCDNPSCVNPLHLFAGTQQQNMQDASKKNRITTTKFMLARQRGSAHHNAKLQEQQVIEIIKLKGIKTATETARLFSIHITTVIAIWNKEAWRHIS